MLPCIKFYAGDVATFDKPAIRLFPPSLHPFDSPMVTDKRDFQCAAYVFRLQAATHVLPEWRKCPSNTTHCSLVRVSLMGR